MPSRLNWGIQQENLLKVLRQNEKIASWKKIAQILNEKFTDSCRSGKQCRDRYINYVRFNQQCPKNVMWTPEEDKLLFNKYQQHGAKWVHISSQMAGRSQNNLKNRFYGAMRKIMRKIVKVEKQMKPKPKKCIKERQLIKNFQQCRNIASQEEQQRRCQKSYRFKNQLYQKLLNIAISQQDQINNQHVKDIIHMIHQHNSVTNKSFMRKKMCPNSSSSQQTSKSSSQIFVNQNIKNTPSRFQGVAYKQQNAIQGLNQIYQNIQENSMWRWQNPFYQQKNGYDMYDIWKTDQDRGQKQQLSGLP